FGLSHRAHAALTAVDRGGGDGARPKEIAESLGVSRAAATTFVQRLEAKGLVETTPDLEDDRGVRVTLTRRGLEVLLRVGPRGRWIEVVRRAADGAGVPVAVLVDLQGPRIRVGELASSRVLRPGAVVVFAPQELATGDEIPTTYADLARDARPGARILLNDGLLAVV